MVCEGLGLCLGVVVGSSLSVMKCGLREVQALFVRGGSLTCLMLSGFKIAQLLSRLCSL